MRIYSPDKCSEWRWPHRLTRGERRLARTVYRITREGQDDFLNVATNRRHARDEALFRAFAAMQRRTHLDSLCRENADQW